MRKNHRTRMFYWSWVILWMALIFVLSGQPAAESSGLSGMLIRRFLEFFMPGFNSMDMSYQAAAIESLQFIVRKSAHFSSYAILGGFGILAFSQYPLDRPRRISYAVLICVLYAATDEIHQLFVPGRSAELGDVAIDTAGALVGIFVVSIATRLVAGRGGRRRTPVRRTP